MKTPLRTSLILLALLAVVDLGFQSCGKPSYGNGTAYESGVNPINAPPMAQSFVYRGTCADPNVDEAAVQRAGDVYTLIAWNCAPLDPAHSIDRRDIMQNTDTLIYRGRTFTRGTTP